MRTYRIINIISFPDLQVGEEKTNTYNLVFPGFTEEAKTTIRYITKDYFGYEFYEIDHEMLIEESGIAFGFVDGVPTRLDFSGYKKSFTIKFYYKRQEGYALISHQSNVIAHLVKKFKHDSSLHVKIDELALDLNKAKPLVQEFRGVWFRGINPRVSSSSLRGSNLENEPLFDQFQSEGASLTSIIIPFGTINIQLSAEANISSQQKIEAIKDELGLIALIKAELVDKIAN